MEYIATSNSKLDYGTMIVLNSVIEPQNNFKCGGFSALAGTVSVVLTGITDLDGWLCESATVTIEGTSRAKTNGSKCLLENDFGKQSALFKNPKNGRTELRTITVTIADAGQKEVKAA